MSEKQGMVIFGAGGSGKSRLAKEVAAKRGGLVRVTNWKQICSRFGLAEILEGAPATVIVEELPIKMTAVDVAFGKTLISGDRLLVRGRFQEPVVVDPPFFIFTSLSKPPFLTKTPYSRLDFVVLPERVQ